MGKVFRTSAFGGFKKKDVITYLESLAKEKLSRSADADSEIVRLEKQGIELEQKLEASHETIENLRSALKASTAEKHELEARAAALEREKNALSASVLKLEEEKQALTDEAAQAAEAQAREMKAKEYLQGMPDEAAGLAAMRSAAEAGLMAAKQSVSDYQRKQARGYHAGVYDTVRIDIESKDDTELRLDDLLRQLEDIIAEIGRIIRNPVERGWEDGAHTKEETLGKAAIKLGSVRDILECVRKMNDQ